MLLTFTTKHVVGLRSEAGLELLIHVGLGTVNMRGQGFVTHFDEGQYVNKGDLLLEFDRDQIDQSGYKDDVIVLLAKAKQLQDVTYTTQKIVKAGDELVKARIQP